jgi:pyridinium-3,5-biscarboxylic acid mononucleotide synthase
VTQTPGPDARPDQDQRTADLGFARVDLERAARTGDPEVVYGAGKTPEQVAAILTTLHANHPERAVLATRLSPAAMDAARGVGATVHETARAATLGPLPAAHGRVGVLSAGTSDAPVAAEVALTVACHGAEPVEIRDVGVAGLHRLMAVRDRLDEVDCLVVVAGMEGALPSVVGGLTGTPLIAVPTSVGYGASFGGLAALLGMLNSCAPGVTVVNIDNGYGAGVAAARIARRTGAPATDGPATDGARP